MEKKRKVENLIYKDLAYKIVDCFYSVYNELGPDYKESEYHRSLAIEFDIQHIP